VSSSKHGYSKGGKERREEESGRNRKGRKRVNKELLIPLEPSPRLQDKVE
jgi:hypothetical protein